MESFINDSFLSRNPTNYGLRAKEVFKWKNNWFGLHNSIETNSGNLREFIKKLY